MKENTKLKIIIGILIFVLLSIIIYIFSKKNYYNTPVKQVSPEEAKKKLSNHEYDYIIDVRTDEEWNEAHLPFENVIHIPIGILVSELPKKIKNKDSYILFVCKKGIRAEAANVISNKLGYKNIEFLDREYTSLL